MNSCAGPRDDDRVRSERRQRRWPIARIRTKERGFTLIELLLVVMILGILAAVVSISVVGLIGHGEEETYATDERTIQLAVSTFYADGHAYAAGAGGWNEAGGYTSAHTYPTGSGSASALYAADEWTDFDGHEVWEILGFVGGTPEERRAEVAAAAVWMGLLNNGPGDGAAGADVAPGDASSPLAGEHGPYLHPLPKSCSIMNTLRGTGTITWIVGAYGRVYGIWEQDGTWYAGFGGRYP